MCATLLEVVSRRCFITKFQYIAWNFTKKELYYRCFCVDGCLLSFVHDSSVSCITRMFAFLEYFHNIYTRITAWKVSVFGVFLVRIQPKCGKIRTRKTPNTNTIHAVDFCRRSKIRLTYIFWTFLEVHLSFERKIRRILALVNNYTSSAYSQVF